MRTILTHVTMLAAAVWTVGLGSAVAVAQPRAVDPRWAPWVGCWRLVTESDRRPALDPADAMASAARRAARRGDAVVVCIAPGEQPEAVVQSTVVIDRPVLETTVVADGTERPISEPNCRGTQRAEWSRSGHRLFSFAQLACEGQAPRKISTLSLLVDGPTWLDIQMVDVGGRQSVRVRRYEPAADHAAAGGRLPEPAGGWPLASTLMFDDVKEASGKVAPAVLEAALVETDSKFPLNGKRLRELSDAGVSEDVIDLMVALTFPKRFVVERGSGSWGPVGGFSSPWGWDDAFGMLSLYAPFSYRYWGYYDPYYNPAWGWVVVTPTPPGGGAAPSQVEARVVDGRGYTRVHPRQPEPAPLGGGASDASGDGGSTGSASSGSSSGVPSGVSSSGYSGGGSSGTGRTAVPRPPGGE
jgi:hypothetical protein